MTPNDALQNQNNRITLIRSADVRAGRGMEPLNTHKKVGGAEAEKLMSRQSSENFNHMKQFIFLLAFCAMHVCCPSGFVAQVPDWVVRLTSEVFSFEVAQISDWEERQMTWYHISDQADGADSIRTNSLYVEGITTAGNKFIGAIPTSNQALNALGSRGIKGQTCVSMCGCQCCKFQPNDYGCYCDKQRENCCEQQSGCSCWCQHTLTY